MPNISDIPTLISEVERLQGSTDWWANIALWLTAATALAGVLYFGASRMTIWRGGQLRIAQVTLANAKDELARIEAAQARDRYTELKTTSDRVATDLEIQKGRTALSEKAVLELRQQMADRVLKPEQRKKMLAVLKTRPVGKITFESLLSEGAEALKYAQEIASVFREAGWTVVEPRGNGSFGGQPMFGVFLVESADMEAQGWGDFISKVLLAGEVSPSPIVTSPETRRGNGVLDIWVAAKPK
jgi:hypothetical protein